MIDRTTAKAHQSALDEVELYVEERGRSWQVNQEGSFRRRFGRRALIAFAITSSQIDGCGLRRAPLKRYPWIAVFDLPGTRWIALLPGVVRSSSSA
ncbi:hypothetical protein ACFIOY_18975 [Bradyrhizobium sp. TZ2]